MFQEKYLPIIMQEIRSIRKKYGLSANSPICDYIFFILKNECILIEWPEEKQLDLDGFSTEKVVNGRLETIVYINSAKNKEKQNFCAAHELGHRHKLERQLRENVINAIITERGITRLRIPDRKVQYSKRLDNINNILKNTHVTKYMGTNELKKYLKEMGIVEEDIQLSEDMKKFATETIDIDGI